MQLQETLTKENFWNDIYAKYPKATQEFCDWIDEYKKAANWDRLFNSDSNWQDSSGKNAPAPKFHDLPYAMQLGIWFTYVRRFEDSGDYITEMTKEEDFVEDLPGMIDCFFAIRTEEIENPIED